MDDIFYDNNLSEDQIDIHKFNSFNTINHLPKSDILTNSPSIIPKIQTQKNKYTSKIPILSNQQQFTCKGNKKNKYLNRITKITQENIIIQNKISISQHIQNSLNHPKSTQSEPLQYDSDKKSKNRLSAKMSRQRKKIYMQLLETKVNDLEFEIMKKKQQLQFTKNHMKKLVVQNQTMNSFAIQRQNIIKTLQKLIQKQRNSNLNENQINILLQALNQNANGNNKTNTINQYFNQIVNVSFPALHRYIMWTASQRKHVFSDAYNQSEQWYKQLDEKLGLTQEQRRQIKSRRQQIEKQQKVLLKIVNNLYEDRIQMQLKSEQLQQATNQLRNILTPIQFSKFILFIQKNKYRKQLNIWQNKIYGNTQNLEDKITKKIKI